MRVALVALMLSMLTRAAEPGFQPMTDWNGDPRLWNIQDGLIIGSTDGNPITHNTFLITKRTYSDFILRTDVKLRNHNSGIQFRSEALPEWVVRGLQADMADNNWWGSIYDEKGTRGTIVNGWKGKAETVLRPHDWNQYEITCDGDFIQLKVNGLVTAELHDASKTSGVIALQLHMGEPMRVEFRNIRIKELNKK